MNTLGLGYECLVNNFVYIINQQIITIFINVFDIDIHLINDY